MSTPNISSSSNKRRIPSHATADQAESPVAAKKVKREDFSNSISSSLTVNLVEQPGEKEFKKGVNFWKAKNYKQAWIEFESAAKQEHAPAQYSLAVFYEKGIGVPKNSEKAFELFQTAANQGDVDSQNKISYCYQLGIGVVQDEKKAVQLYQKIADKGDPRAQTSLGFCYQQGIGVAKNEIKAVQLYQQAAARGYQRAKDRLAALQSKIHAYAHPQPVMKCVKIEQPSG